MSLSHMSDNKVFESSDCLVFPLRVYVCACMWFCHSSCCPLNKVNISHKAISPRFHFFCKGYTQIQLHSDSAGLQFCQVSEHRQTQRVFQRVSEFRLDDMKYFKHQYWLPVWETKWAMSVVSNIAHEGG